MLVYEEKDIGFYVALSATQSSKYILIDAHDHQSSEVYLIDADAPLERPAPRRAAPARPRVRRRAPRRSPLHHHQLGGAEDFRICTGAARSPGMAQLARDDPPPPGLPDPRHHSSIAITWCGWSARTACRASSCAGSPTAAEHTIAFPEEAYALGVSSGYEFDTTTLALRLLLDDDAGRDLRLRHGDARPHACASARRCRAGMIPADYVTRRLYAPAPDGETVPVSILYRRDTPARRLGARLPLRLRRVRHLHPRLVLDDAPVARRPRLHLRHRPYPRRQGQGLPLVHGRQAQPRRSTPSPTSSRPASTLSRRA